MEFRQVSDGALRLYDRAKFEWCQRRNALAGKLAKGAEPTAAHFLAAQKALADDYDRDVRKFLADPRYGGPEYDRYATLPVPN
jgi:hypothetical protein